MQNNTEGSNAGASPVEREVRLVSTWMGRPMTELSREELLEVVEWCGREIQNLRADRSRWQKAADPIKYLMANGTQA